MASDQHLALDTTLPLSDWELWACARQQIAQHGDAAVMMAAMQADRLLAGGDLAGHNVWLAIMSRIGHLSGPVPGDTCH